MRDDALSDSTDEPPVKDITCQEQGWIKERASRAAARGANLYGALRRQRCNRKYSGFHARNNFSEDNPQIGHIALKMFASTLQGRKSLENISLTALQIIILAGEPKY